jgi:hypothetical protein
MRAAPFVVRLSAISLCFFLVLGRVKKNIKKTIDTQYIDIESNSSDSHGWF